MIRQKPPALPIALCATAALLLAACDRGILPAPAQAPEPSAQPVPAPKRAPASPALGTAPAPSASKEAQPLASAHTARPTDEEITASATSALRADPALAGTDLSVTTDHGVVSLTGSVRSPEQVAEAEARALAPTGVMRVDTHVSVNPG